MVSALAVWRGLREYRHSDENNCRKTGYGEITNKSAEKKQIEGRTVNGENKTEINKKIFHAPGAKIYFFDVSDIILRTSADNDSGNGGDSELTDCDWTKNY